MASKPQKLHHIERSLRDVQQLLLANIAPTSNLSDERTVVCIRVVVGWEEVGQALEKAADTAVCFALREVKHVLDQRQTPKVTIERLWRIMEQLHFPHDIKQNPMILWWKKPSAL